MLRRAALVVVLAAVAGVAAGVVAHVLAARSAVKPAAPALPELHGQATWAAGKRPAPQFTLRCNWPASCETKTPEGRCNT